ncbi:MAG TPA: hypothetical protein VMF86_12865 [Stellaceae bacterium]|nr:hypothetical protein [Stellaceae bacterium]
MGKNTGEGHRVGFVKNRVQIRNPRTDRWIKVDTKTGRIIDQKKTREPYKGIRQK